MVSMWFWGVRKTITPTSGCQNNQPSNFLRATGKTLPSANSWVYLIKVVQGMLILEAEGLRQTLCLDSECSRRHSDQTWKVGRGKKCKCNRALMIGGERVILCMVIWQWEMWGMPDWVPRPDGRQWNHTPQLSYAACMCGKEFLFFLNLKERWWQ